ncbi:hypothetical protein SUGI_0837570 [Cryptomeria japonica]|nr:hypothetical protein SUGI_0837570 [Cryptomeria japonica]
MTSTMVRAEVGKGLRQQFGEGIMQDGMETEFKPFILQNDGADHEARTEEARVGRGALKDYICERVV